jgi:hypothetical protein
MLVGSDSCLLIVIADGKESRARSPHETWYIYIICVHLLSFIHEFNCITNIINRCSFGLGDISKVGFSGAHYDTQLQDWKHSHTPFIAL